MSEEKNAKGSFWFDLVSIISSAGIIVAIIFVRGKTPDETMIQMADEMGLPIITTGHRMFSSCGLLYEHGLTGGIIDG